MSDYERDWVLISPAKSERLWLQRCLFFPLCSLIKYATCCLPEGGMYRTYSPAYWRCEEWKWKPRDHSHSYSLHHNRVSLRSASALGLLEYRVLNSEVPLMSSRSSRRKVIFVPSLSLYSIPNAHWHLPPPFYRNCSLKSQKLFFRKVSACHMGVFHGHTVGLLCWTGFCRSLFSSKSHFQNLNSVIL